MFQSRRRIRRPLRPGTGGIGAAIVDQRSDATRFVVRKTFVELDENASVDHPGVTYFLLLSLFPALGALVALYGFIADPATIMGHSGFLASVFPPGSFDLILNRLTALTEQKTSTPSFVFVTDLIVALWSANSGMKASFDAMNVACQEDEKRSLIPLNLRALAFTFGALIIAIVLIVAIGVLPAALAYLWLDKWQELLARFVRCPSFSSLSGVV